MAVTSYGVNASEAVKLWSRKLFRESLNQTSLRPFIGDDTNSIVQIMDEPSKGMGDRVRATLRAQLGGDGISGDSTLEGQEEALVTHTDDLLIDQLRHAVRSGGRMTEQRIPFGIRNEARLGLQDWWSDRIDQSLFNQLAGNNAQSDTKFTGLNAVTAPDANHHIFSNGSADEAITAAATFSLSLIDQAVEKAETLDFPIRPLIIGGEPWYVLFVHPFQAKDMRTNTSTAEWADIQKAAMQGGQIAGNPIFTGALGVYNQTIIHKNVRIPLGVNSSTSASVADTRRAVFCGAQAAVMATGRDNSDSQMTWVEELFDYQNQLGVSAGMIWGGKRTIFNSESFGSLVISSRASGTD